MMIQCTSEFEVTFTLHGPLRSPQIRYSGLKVISVLCGPFKVASVTSSTFKS